MKNKNPWYQIVILDILKKIIMISENICWILKIWIFNVRKWIFWYERTIFYIKFFCISKYF